MPSKTMKATKTLDLGVFGTLPKGRSAGITSPLTKLTVRTPTPDDRKARLREGSIRAATLVLDCASGQPKVVYLSMPAALGLLRGLLAVVHPLEIAADEETAEALKHAQETIDEAVADVTAAVEAVVDSGLVIETRTLETVPATLEDVTPPAEGRPLVDVLTEDEDRPDPTVLRDAPDASAADTPGSPSSESASPTPDRSSGVAEPSVN